MVNGNYVLYGDRPCSESEIVDDHVQSRTADRRPKRKTNRTANELQPSLNLAQLDNETDSVKYEKKIKEPKLLRYVPTTDVEENFVTEKFETYDLQPSHERPRRHTFTKKPKNSSDSSVNYACSRSNSSSPNANLPTISEHGEQYGTYRVRSTQPSTKSNSDMFSSESYASKLDKMYFSKPRESGKYASKVNYNGSHPDSLYRVSANSGADSSNMVRVMRALRWPMALLLVCTALAVFVYFLMPDNLDSDAELANSTIWQARPISAGQSLFHKGEKARKVINSDHPLSDLSGKKKPKPVEIDFYDSENGTNVELISITQETTEVRPNRNLPAAPVFPEHLTPEVQYGNEKADTDKTRSPKILNEQNNLPEDSTLKPHITQKPEKPLAIYFKDVIGGLKPEIITRAETVNDFDVYEKVTAEEPKEQPTRYRVKEEPGRYIPPEVQEYYGRPSYPDGNFTSGHSKFFGIGIEDVETMKSTTQSSVYNTRVSPTLPTWRDGDDSTTKNYPLNLNTDVRNCRTPNLPLCRGVLPYDLAGPPPTLAGVEITSLLPQMEYLVSTNCSERTRLFVCSLMEPECNPPPFPAKTPCYNLCKAVTDNCETHIPAALAPVFNCKRYEKSNCMNARAPCYMREMACDDGTCVPREWICDGKEDCSSGEDEKKCRSCEKNQFRCSAGTCIMQRWVCDGYLDCPDGDDESQKICGKANAEARVTEEEPGEEPAGSAPAPSVRRPNKIQERKRKPERIGDNDSSKELLMTSDSNNALKRNFTRRPSSSRLTPYKKPSLPKRPTQEAFVEEESEETTPKPTRKPTIKTTVQPSADTQQGSSEDINIADLRFFEDIEKLSKDENGKSGNLVPKSEPLYVPKNTMSPQAAKLALSQMNKDTKQFSRVIDSGALLRTAAEELEREKAKLRNMSEPEEYERPKSSHTSPCPSGELRCVDGRCITLAQLCDGTIDCTDHADEDNCYT